MEAGEYAWTPFCLQSIAGAKSHQRFVSSWAKWLCGFVTLAPGPRSAFQQEAVGWVSFWFVAFADWPWSGVFLFFSFHDSKELREKVSRSKMSEKTRYSCRCAKYLRPRSDEHCPQLNRRGFGADICFCGLVATQIKHSCLCSTVHTLVFSGARPWAHYRSHQTCTARPSHVSEGNFRAGRTPYPRTRHIFNRRNHLRPKRQSCMERDIRHVLVRQLSGDFGGSRTTRTAGPGRLGQSHRPHVSQRYTSRLWSWLGYIEPYRDDAVYRACLRASEKTLKTEVPGKLSFSSFSSPPTV